MPGKAIYRNKTKQSLSESGNRAAAESAETTVAKVLPGDRRAQILNAAACLFAEHGYEATSMRQIANEVNLLAGSLYHHFATKEDMLHAILQEHLGAMVDDTIGLSQLPADAEHKLVASVILRFTRYIEHWPFHAILLQEARFFRRQADFAYVVEAKAKVFDIYKEILAEGMRSALFHADIDTYMMIGTISRMLSSAAAWFLSGDLVSSDRPPQYSLDSLVDYHIDCVLRLVREPSRLAEPVPRDACKRLLASD